MYFRKHMNNHVKTRRKVPNLETNRTETPCARNNQGNHVHVKKLNENTWKVQKHTKQLKIHENQVKTYRNGKKPETFRAGAPCVRNKEGNHTHVKKSSENTCKNQTIQIKQFKHEMRTHEKSSENSCEMQKSQNQSNRIAMRSKEKQKRKQIQKQVLTKFQTDTKMLQRCAVLKLCY